MNRNRLLAIGVVALALAFVVSLALYRTLRSATNAVKTSPTTEVVAAAVDLPLGTRLQEKDLRLVKLPGAELPPGTFHSVQEVVGRGVLVPLAQNELILNSKVAAENAGAGLPALIPQGMRAVSVKVNEVISVAGFVTSGTRVDVLLTGSPTKEQDAEHIVTTTVLKNVQVLAAGQKLQQNEKGEPQQVTVVTLLVNPEDAQKLALASQEGRIQLALRNPLDTSKEEVALTRNPSLYGVGALTAPRPQVRFAKSMKPTAPPPPSAYIVEMIKGNERNLSKF